MKQFLFTALLCFSVSAFASVIPPAKNVKIPANSFMVPLIGTKDKISLEAYVHLTPKEYKALTGKKLSFTEKIELKFSQKAARKFIQKDGTVNSKLMKKAGWGQWQWHWGGFALGFFLSFIGVIIALFFNDDYKWDRFWTAFKAATLVAAILLLVAAATGA